MSTPGADRFFVVGGQRCGTTSLYHALDAHPDITMARPLQPEPKRFLAANWRDVDDESVGAFATMQLHGEKSVSYLESARVAQRIAAVYPGARIVAQVRDPVARALSHYGYTSENGLEDLPPAEAFTEQAERRPFAEEQVATSPYLYLRRGCYAELLEPWLHHFPEAVKVVVLEEVLADPDLLAPVQTFLGVAERSASLDAHNVGSTESVNVDGATRERLKQYYAPPNRALEALLGRDFALWPT